jgi:ketopantoate reductase
VDDRRLPSALAEDDGTRGFRATVRYPPPDVPGKTGVGAIAAEISELFTVSIGLMSMSTGSMSSLLVDVEKNGSNECETPNDSTVRLEEQHQINVPINALICSAIRLA